MLSLPLSFSPYFYQYPLQTIHSVHPKAGLGELIPHHMEIICPVVNEKKCCTIRDG